MDIFFQLWSCVPGLSRRLESHCKSWRSVCSYNNFTGNFPAYLNPIYLCVTMQLRRLKFSNAHLLRRYLDLKHIHSVWFNLSWFLSNFHLTRYKREREREGGRGSQIHVRISYDLLVFATILANIHWNFEWEFATHNGYLLPQQTLIKF